MEGTATGIAVGIVAGVSLGAFLDSKEKPEKFNKRESKLLIMVVIATLILVLSTAFMAYSGMLNFLKSPFCIFLDVLKICGEDFF
ncbi:TPA: hypothetical protein HA338_16650 [Methanosarcina acetivorans]|uniref:Uncharacterized protein n=2 Tax=Methanosarcina acetivorans TaxID=2214 RepID=Q8TSL8_METAC|nr:hypothetical protein [Methanosarcina acetivorans]AAM04217.1 predicted protein [Methanosarcina acetivorans C2A]HIH95562.1 hypothetical protein [Methanosarcina acetivorans]